MRLLRTDLPHVQTTGRTAPELRIARTVSAGSDREYQSAVVLLRGEGAAVEGQAVIEGQRFAHARPVRPTAAASTLKSHLACAIGHRWTPHSSTLEIRNGIARPQMTSRRTKYTCSELRKRDRMVRAGQRISTFDSLRAFASRANPIRHFVRSISLPEMLQGSTLHIRSQPSLEEDNFVL